MDGWLQPSAPSGGVTDSTKPFPAERSIDLANASPSWLERGGEIMMPNKKGSPKKGSKRGKSVTKGSAAPATPLQATDTTIKLNNFVGCLLV